MHPRLKQFVIKPLLEQKKRLSLIVVSLFVLSISQGLLLVLVGPLIKALFLPASFRESVDLKSVVQPQLLEFFPSLQEISLNRLDLCYYVPLAILVAGFFKSIATYFYQLNQQGVALFVAKTYRDKLFRALLDLPFIMIREKSAGEWMSRIMNDVLFLQTRLSDVMSSFVKDGVLILTSYSIIVWIHWPSALAITLISPFIAFGMGRTGKKIATYAEQFQRELAKISTSVLDFRNRFDFIRSQKGEKLEISRFERANEDYFQATKKSIFIRSVFAPAMELIGFCGFAAVLFAVSRGYWDVSAGIMFQFFAAIGLMLKPLRNFGEQAARFHETMGSLHENMRLFDKVDDYKKQKSTSSLVARPPNAKLDIEIGVDETLLNIVEVKYSDKTALRVEGLKLARGKAIAIVGPSGAGKSTFIKVLAGLVEPAEWQANISFEAIKAQTSMVSQDPFLFDDLLDSNLLYGLEIIPNSEKIDSILTMVNIKNEVAAMDQGLKTYIRAIGNNLSGGQVQRLVIARALLRDKPILLLDEATSAVDSDTEEDITSRLIETSKQSGLILISVTHRLKWLMKYDEVWFFEEGELKMMGHHNELVKNQRYFDFYTSSEGQGEA